MSAASVSRQVGALEDHLQVRLLHRTTRAVSVTPAGRGYYARCVDLLDDLDELEASLRESRHAPRGTVRISAPMSLGLTRLAAMLAEFCRPYPQLTLDLRLSDRKADLVAEGFDLALRITAVLPDSTLVAARLGSVRNVICASPEWVSEHGLPRDPEELAEHPCLVYAGHERPDRWRFEGPEGTIVVPVPVAMICDNSLVLREGARTGLGPASLPGFAAEEDLACGRLVALCPDWRGPEFTASVVYPPHRYLSQRVRLVIDFLKEQARLGRLGLEN